MGRQASDATLLRHAKREINELDSQRAYWRVLADQYRDRATKAEQEVAEWKERFDLLLRRDNDGRADLD